MPNNVSDLQDNVNGEENNYPSEGQECFSSSDIARLKSTLERAASIYSNWFFVAGELVRFFGPHPIGRQLFLEWAANCVPTDHVVPEGISDQPEQAWINALDISRNLRRPKPTIDELISSLLKLMPTLLERRVPNWPELMKDGRTPAAKSQLNIAAFLYALNVLVYRNDFSGRYHVENFEGFDELDDDAMRALWLKADHLGLKPPYDYFDSVVRDIGRKESRHPIRKYLDDLSWDGTKRLDDWLARYTGAADTKLNRAFGAKWMIAAVRRVRQPGVKFDQLLVLEGPQGAGKSTLARVLTEAAGENLFEDGLTLGAEIKQVIEQTRGKWIVEISELRGFDRDLEAMKAMLSRREDTARLSYGRSATTIPRQFVMIATTNSSEYLRDPTGNRRWWPVKVGTIDLKGLALARDQLWAEAAAREAAGETLELAPSLYAAAGELQGERVMSDPIYEAISAELADYGGSVSMDALWTMVGLGEEKRDRRDQKHLQAIGRAMTRLGWERARYREHGLRRYQYKKDAPSRLHWSVDGAGVVRREPELGSDRKVAPIGRRREAEPNRPQVSPRVPGYSDQPGDSI